MINKYAIDPEVVEDVLSFAVLVRDLGIEHGRVLNDDFPNRWIQSAKVAIRRMPAGRTRKLAEEYLTALSLDGTKRMKSNVPFDPEDTWQANAQRSCSSFRAAVCAETTPLAPGLASNLASASDITSPNHPLWAVERESRFSASVSETMGMLLPLIYGARRVVVLEPFLHPEKRGHLDIVKEVLRAVQPGGRVEFHASYHQDKSNPPLQTNDWQRAWRTQLAGAANNAHVIANIARWDPRPRVSRLHLRGVLTECGGIRLERGIHIKTGDTNDASIMGRTWSRETYREFTRENAESYDVYNFKRVDNVVIAPE